MYVIINTYEYIHCTVKSDPVYTLFKLSTVLFTLAKEL